MSIDRLVTKKAASAAVSKVTHPAYMHSVVCVCVQEERKKKEMYTTHVSCAGKAAYSCAHEKRNVLHT